MPVLQNERWELFARYLSKGLPAYQAYLKAGYHATTSTAHVNGSRLLSKAKVSERVQELRSRIRERITDHVVLDAAELVDTVYIAMRRALELDQLAVAAKCAELLGREVGSFTEKRIIGHQLLDNLEDRELEAVLTIDQEPVALIPPPDEMAEKP